MDQKDFKKWEVEQYYKRTRIFWLTVFMIDTIIGFYIDKFWGASVGFLFSALFVTLYSLIVRAHPEETSDENWSISSDKFLKK